MSISPIVVIASTSPDFAVDLGREVSSVSEDCGLDLMVGPMQTRTHFRGKEELFTFLDGLGALALIDTLVILHVGTDYEECFQSRLHSRNSGWHKNRLSDVGVGMELVLRFPQVTPIFILTEERDGGFQAWLDKLAHEDAINESSVDDEWTTLQFIQPMAGNRLSEVVTRFATGFRTCFDPTGIRTLLRNRFLGEVFGSDSDWKETHLARSVLNERLNNLVVTVEEESELSWLAAYAAYKFGARSLMILNYSSLTNDATPKWTALGAPNLVVLRDIDLRFPDYPDMENLPEETGSIRNDLKNIHSKAWREIDLPERCVVRAFSYDQNVVEEPDGFREVDLRLGQKSFSAGVKYLGLRKPLRSIYSLAMHYSFCKGMSLMSRLPRARDQSEARGHGAGYQNLRIANDLLEQAGDCRSHRDVRASITASLLGEEAYSLLLGMSETTCLEAMREIHLGEAKAEGEFAGVAHSVESRGRREELERTVGNLGLKDQGASFLARIWAELRIVYKLTEQFEASEEANAESLANSVWVVPSPKLASLLRNVKRTILVPIHSLRWLLFIVLLWPFILTLMYCWAYGWTFSPTPSGIKSLIDLYHHVLIAVIRPEGLHVHGIHSGLDESLFKEVLDILMSMTSVLFVGLIVTVLFRKSTRG